MKVSQVLEMILKRDPIEHRSKGKEYLMLCENGKESVIITVFLIGFLHPKRREPHHFAHGCFGIWLVIVVESPFIHLVSLGSGMRIVCQAQE